MIASGIRFAREMRRRYIADTSFVLPFLRVFYRMIARVLTSLPIRGIPVHIGAYGTFRIEPALVFGRYDYASWGSTHNSGFQQWVEACRGASVVFDVGAHIGLYTLPASKGIAPHGRLYAFEPGERNVLALTHHLFYNRVHNVEVVPFLVGERDASSVPFFEEKDTVEGTNSIIKEKSPASHRSTLKQQISLDSFCKTRNIIPNVIKIDVEGGELFVLRGGLSIMKKYHPVIFLSVHPRHLALLGESVETLRQCIRELGYRIYDSEGRAAHMCALNEYILH